MGGDRGERAVGDGHHGQADGTGMGEGVEEFARVAGQREAQQRARAGLPGRVDAVGEQ